MLETTRSGTRFYCPECGFLIRAPRADAGSSIPCLNCGEQIRVPRTAHPLESDADDSPLIPLPAARLAADGIHHLLVSLWLWLTMFLLTLVVLGLWAILEGPGAVFNRQTGHWTRAIAVSYGIRLGLLAVGVGMRWVGYGRCREAAEAVRAGGWVTTVRLGAVLTLIGYGSSVCPALLGYALAETPLMLRAVTQLGDFILTTGIVLEMAALLVWFRLLSEAARPSCVQQVRRYGITAVAAVAITIIGMCGTGVVTTIALGHAGSQPNAMQYSDPHLNYKVVPTAGWIAAGVVFTLATGFLLVLFYQYRGMLRATRHALSVYPQGTDLPDDLPGIPG
ncbi:MAG: hypothetical protein LC104_04240 [Bacteroidales bacterium]|nr:hypothetical protein [Bacteroidales bacterium]